LEATQEVSSEVQKFYKVPTAMSWSRLGTEVQKNWFDLVDEVVKTMSRF